MTIIVSDTGPIISLTLNNLCHVLDELKKKKDVKFYITPKVKRELVDKPFETKKFKFEAMQVMHHMRKGTIEVFNDKRLQDKAKYLLDLANSCYFIKDRKLEIVHFAEIESVAAALILNSPVVVIDERTTRLLIEDPKRLNEILKHKLNSNVIPNAKNIERFRNEVKTLKVIRSAEILAIAYEEGILDKYVPTIPNAKKELLESVLWGVKLSGCSISQREIDTIVKLELND